MLQSIYDQMTDFYNSIEEEYATFFGDSWEWEDFHFKFFKIQTISNTIMVNNKIPMIPNTISEKIINQKFKMKMFPIKMISEERTILFFNISIKIHHLIINTL